MSRGKKAVLASAGLALAVAFIWANPASAELTKSGSAAGVDDLAPAAVTELTAVADITGPSVELSWVKSESDFVRQSPTGLDLTSGGTFNNVNDVSAYNIRRDDGSGVQLIDSVGAGEDSYIDESVLSGVIYTYSVTAADAAGNESEAAVSDQISLKAADPGTGVPDAPEGDLDFGDVALDESISENFAFSNSSDDPEAVLIVSVSVEGDGYSLSTGTLSVAPGESGSFDITFSAADVANDNGSYPGSMTIRTNDPENLLTIIALAAVITTGLDPAAFDLSADAIEFGVQALYIDASETFTITNAGGADLEVTLVLAGDDVFTLFSEAETLGEGESADIEVVFTPGESIDYSATITIATNDADNPSATVALSGTGEEAPEFEADLELSSDTIEFDDTMVGGTSEMTLTISNSGDADLTSSIAIDGDAFTLDTEGDLADLAPGESVEVTVVFAPTDVIDYTGTITVTSNGGDDTVDLSGSGLAVGSPVRIGVDENGNDLFGYLSRDSDGNLDDVINLSDFFIFADAFGKSPGDGGHNPGADFNQDGKINLADFFSFADSFGKTAVSFRN